MTVNLKLANSILIFLIMTLSFSCFKKEHKYFYAYYLGKDSIPSSYLVRKVQYDKNYRIDLIFSSKSIEGPFKQVNKEKYVLQKDGLNKVITNGDSTIIKPYLTIANKDCIEFLFDNGMDDVLATTQCFLGKKDLIIGSKKYKNAYKFKKEKGKLDGVESIVYYDTDLIFLKEEYVSGYADEYRIVRLDTSITAW